MTDTYLDDSRDLTPDDRSTLQQALETMRTPRRAPWRDGIGWTLLGMLVLAGFAALGVYGVLEALSGYWVGF